MADKIIRGAVRKPLAMVLYGPPGVGKTDFCAGAPNVCYIGPEELDEKTFARVSIAKTSEQIIKQMKDFSNGVYANEKFQSIAIDSIDATEKLIIKEICDKEPGKTMATACGGYGKAWDEVGRKLWQIREILEKLRDHSKYNILIIGHAFKSNFTDPILNIEYETYEMTLHKGKRIDFNAFFTEWASLVIFMGWKTYKDKEGKAQTMKERVLYTEFSPSYVAKNRFNLPVEILIPNDAERKHDQFKILMGHIDRYYNGLTKESEGPSFELQMMVKEAKELANKITDENTKKAVIQSITEQQNNLIPMTTIRDRLRVITNS